MKQLKIIVLLNFMLFCVSPIFAMSEVEEFELIKERYIASLLDNVVDEQTVANYLNELDFESGAWRDVDYKDTQWDNDGTSAHYKRLAKLSIYYYKYREDQSLFTRQALSDAIHAVWRYWFVNKPLCITNWVPTKISVPRDFSTSFLLLRDEMSDEEYELADQLILSKAAVIKSATNMIWSANAMLIASLVQNDIKRAREAIDAISSTIKVAEQGFDGIQRDNSYHQHGPQQQFGGYGLHSISSYTQYFSILEGTSFAFREEQIDILVDFIHDGFNWVLWGGYLDFNALGRSSGRDRMRMKGEKAIAIAKELLKACNEKQRVKIQNFIDDNSGDPIKRLGQKYFYCSDGLYHHTPNWMISLRMSSVTTLGDGHTEGFYSPEHTKPYWLPWFKSTSPRVVGAEQGYDTKGGSISYVNRKGYYAADGAFCTYVDGDEYVNSVVLWDWRKVPGITCFESDEAIKNIQGPVPPNLSSFVGGCTDRKSGITSMILNRDTTIFARKSWVVTDDFALCLGSDIHTTTHNATLTTSIDQRLAQGELFYLDKCGWREIEGKEVFREKEMRFYHDKVGYIVFDGSETEGSIEYRENNWSELSSSNNEMARGNVFSLFVRHRDAVDAYKYLILPARSMQEVEEFDTKAIKVHHNDKDVVVVEYKDQLYITAFSAGKYRIRGEEFRVVTPCIFMIKGNGEIIAYDPTQVLSEAEIREKIIIE